MWKDLAPPRFLPFANFDAATNMAIDEAILEAHLQGLVPTTLRLYGFAPAAISIGHGQKLEAKTLKFIESQGFSVVRRPTGGRAVLHLNDLTYSFVCSSKQASSDSSLERAGCDLTSYESASARQAASGCKNGGDDIRWQGDWPPGQGGLVSRSVKQAYLEICRGLIATLAHFNLELQLGNSETSYRHSQDCFQVTTAADLHYQGKKLVGSAQLRRKDAVLQHGSLLLNQPQGAMSELLNDQDSMQTELTEKAHRHANLFELVKAEVPMERLERAFMEGFEQAFAFRFQISHLTTYELKLAEKLREKYELAPS